MRPLRTHWQMWLGIITGWTLFGLAYTFNYYFYSQNYVKIFSKPPTLTEMLVWELPYWFLWSALSPLIFWLSKRFPLKRGQLLRNTLAHVAACVVLALAHRAAYLLIDWGLNVSAYRQLLSLSVVYNQNFFFNLPNGFLCYAA